MLAPCIKQLRAGVESVFAELDDLCLDEPMTPKFIGEMIKKIHFRSVRRLPCCWQRLHIATHRVRPRRSSPRRHAPSLCKML